MADLNRPEVRIQWIVEADTPHGKFRDAIYYEYDKFKDLKDSELTEAADSRVSKWVQALDDIKKATPVVYTKQELIDQKAALLEQEAALAAQAAELDEKIANADVKVVPIDPIKDPVDIAKG